MPQFDESLTLKEAAAFAGVSEGTMRTWAKDISNITRYPGGGYGIPRDELNAYLGAKQWRKSGATKGSGHNASPRPEFENVPSFILQQLEDTRGELAFARERVRDLEAINREMGNNVLSLMREMRELVYGNGKPALSAWMTKVKPDEDEQNQEKPMVVEMKVEPMKSTKPKPIKPAKSSLKPSKSKSKSAKVIKKKSAAKSGKSKR